MIAVLLQCQWLLNLAQSLKVPSTQTASQIIHQIEHTSSALGKVYLAQLVKYRLLLMVVITCLRLEGLAVWTRIRLRKIVGHFYYEPNAANHLKVITPLLMVYVWIPHSTWKNRHCRMRLRITTIWSRCWITRSRRTRMIHHVCKVRETIPPFPAISLAHCSDGRPVKEAWTTPVVASIHHKSTLPLMMIYWAPIRQQCQPDLICQWHRQCLAAVNRIFTIVLLFIKYQSMVRRRRESFGQLCQLESHKCSLDWRGPPRRMVPLLGRLPPTLRSCQIHLQTHSEVWTHCRVITWPETPVRWEAPFSIRWIFNDHHRPLVACLIVCMLRVRVVCVFDFIAPV